MIIKPIKLVPSVQKGEIPDSKISKNQPKITESIQLPTGKWQFSLGVLLLDGRNITHLMKNPSDHPAAFWSAVAHDLDDFRNKYIRDKLKRNVKKRKDDDDVDPTGELGQMSALVEAYIAKIMRILKRKYDETQDGLAFSLDEEGQLTLNGMNITAFIEMAKTYPTDKARIFLKGLKNRLGIILTNKSGSANYDKIYDITMNLFHEIDQIIKQKAAKKFLMS